MTVKVLFPPVLWCLLLFSVGCASWSPSVQVFPPLGPQGNKKIVSSFNNDNNGCTRREGFAKMASAVTTAVTGTAATAAAAAVITTTLPFPAPAAAAMRIILDKKIGIGNEELAQILARDVQENQFLVRADLTRSVYDESATFTDEIDTYAMDAWIQGTQRLFVADKSSVSLVPGSLQVTDTEARFRFTEYLTFNIPILWPKVYLTGEVILTRDPATGLITSYREKWDQDVKDVYKSFQFGG